MGNSLMGRGMLLLFCGCEWPWALGSCMDFYEEVCM